MHQEHMLTTAEDPTESSDTERLLSEKHASEKQLLRPLASQRTKRNRRLKTWIHTAAFVFYSAVTIVLYTWSLGLRAAHVCYCETGMVSCKSTAGVSKCERSGS